MLGDLAGQGTRPDVQPVRPAAGITPSRLLVELSFGFRLAFERGERRAQARRAPGSALRVDFGKLERAVKANTADHAAKVGGTSVAGQPGAQGRQGLGELT